MKREQVTLFKFFNGTIKRIPEGYTEPYICMVLNLTYTQLQEQPTDWVDKMLAMHGAKAQVEEFERKKQEGKMKGRRGR